MEFSEKVKEVRRRLLLTQDQLGKLLGVAYSTVNRWEKGHHQATFLVQSKFDELCKKNGINFK